MLIIKIKKHKAILKKDKKIIRNFITFKYSAVLKK